MNQCDPAELRAPYTGTPLCRDELHPHPMRQFHAWFTQALTAGLAEPNAMVVATVDATGAPRARTVLLKGYGVDGLRFFTNYTSRKARELAGDPRVSAVFPWHAIRRQVLVSGDVEYLTDAENDEYFAQRPRGSQIGAWASGEQSAPIADRSTLLERFEAHSERWTDEETIPRPDYWGGFRVRPTEVEFWQGQPDRLHDRFRYLLTSGEPEDGTWRIDRLAP